MGDWKRSATLLIMAAPLIAGAVAQIGMGIASGFLKAGEAGRVADILRNLPGYTPVDASVEQANAISGNLNALPEASKLASRTNAFNVSETVKRLGQLIPGYEKMSGDAAKNISDMIAGKIPDDVSRNLLRNAAGKALAGGFGGSGLARNLTARDLGTTSLALSQSGIESFQRWIQQQNSLTPRMDVTSMFLTPQQRLPVAMENARMTYQSKLTQALGKTAPGETASWADWMATQGSSMGGMIAGMMGGGGMGGGIGGGIAGLESLRKWKPPAVGPPDTGY